MNLLSHLGSGLGTYLSWVVGFLFVLMVVVFFHELGHFLVARWCGVKIKAFSIGFGKEICGFYDRHGTRWRLAWIPMGGYVKFIDDDTAASTPDRKGFEALSPEERAVTFQGKAIWQRAAIVAAGPIANFLLAIAIFGAFFALHDTKYIVARIGDVAPASAAEVAGLKRGDVVTSINGAPIEGFDELMTIVGTNPGSALDMRVERNGATLTVTATPRLEEKKGPYNSTLREGVLGVTPYMPPRIGDITPGGAAETAHLQKGDLVVSVDGAVVESFDDMRRIVIRNPGNPLSFLINRNGEKLTLTATPRATERKGPDNAVIKEGILGIRADAEPADMRSKHFTPIAAVVEGVKRTKFIVDMTLSYLGKVFTGREKADQIGGPLMIAQVSGEAAKAGLIELLNVAGVISVSIGLMNLFPIPLLDGGHLLFYAIEAIRRRPLSERTQEIGFRIGLAVVLMLFVFATRNDLIRLFG